MGRHRQKTRAPRRKRDLLRKVAEQQAYIDLCDRTIAQLCDENDDLRRVAGWPVPGTEEVTVSMPVLTVPILEPPTHPILPAAKPILRRATGPIPIVLPDGTVLRTEQGRRRPSWARGD
jgi:hypothetical protein